jgi:type III secretion system TyeA family effector delivery regulator
VTVTVVSSTSSSAAGADYTAHDLMREILHLATQRWADPERFRQIATIAGFHAIEARIFFLTQLKERVRMMPLKLFVAPEAREKMLEALQTALDTEISREEIA